MGLWIVVDVADTDSCSTFWSTNVLLSVSNSHSFILQLFLFRSLPSFSHLASPLSLLLFDVFFRESLDEARLTIEGVFLIVPGEGESSSSKIFGRCPVGDVGSEVWRRLNTFD